MSFLFMTCSFNFKSILVEKISKHPHFSFLFRNFWPDLLLKMQKWVFWEYVGRTHQGPYYRGKNFTHLFGFLRNKGSKFFLFISPRHVGKKNLKKIWYTCIAFSCPYVLWLVSIFWHKYTFETTLSKKYLFSHWWRRVVGWGRCYFNSKKFYKDLPQCSIVILKICGQGQIIYLYRKYLLGLEKVKKWWIFWNWFIEDFLV